MQLMTNDLNYTQTFFNEEVLRCEIKQIADKCLGKLSLFALKQEEIDYYIFNLLKPYIFFRPLYWYTNPLVKLVKEHVGDELPACFLFSIKEIEESPEFQAALHREIRKYEQIILSNEDISEEQAEELLALIEIRPNYSETIIDFIMGKILSNKLTINDNLYFKLFFKFIENFKKNRNCDFYAYSKRLPNIIVNGQEMRRNAAVKIKFGHLFMYFNEDTLYSENAGKNLFVFFHEYWHTIQENPEYTSPIFIEMFKMDDFLEQKYPEYKKDNYYYYSYECDANLNALILLFQYFNSLGITKYNKILQIKIKEFESRRNNSRRIDRFGREIDLKDYYNITLAKAEQFPQRK